MKKGKTIEEILTQREIEVLRRNPNLVGFTIGDKHLVTCNEIGKAEVVFDIEFLQLILNKDTKNIYETLILAVNTFLRTYREKISDGGVTELDSVLSKVLDTEREFYKEAWTKSFYKK